MPGRLRQRADYRSLKQSPTSHSSHHNGQVERSVTEPAAEPITSTQQEPTSARALLGDLRLSGRGNSPVQQAALLDMQSTYGNRAAQRFLRSGSIGFPSLAGPTVAGPASSPRSNVQRQWPDATTGGATSGRASVPSGGNWNADDKVKIGSIRRIPVSGLSQGNQVDDKEEGKEWAGDGKVKVKTITGESAVGRAIVLVPDPLGVKEGGSVDVFLYLHGYGIGYRQRTEARMEEVPGTKKGEKKKYREVKGMEKGTVRDIDVDRMEEQLDAVNKANVKAGGHPMVAVMPQGRYSAQLGAQFGKDFNSEAYLDDIFPRVSALKGVTRGRVVLAGHSGAGGTIAPILANAVNSKGELKSEAEMKKAGIPTNLAEVVLFDAINTVETDKGPGQLERVEKWVVAQIRKDLHEMAGMDDASQGTYLQDRMMRFRGYYTNSYSTRYEKLKKDLQAALTRELKRARRDSKNPLALSADHEKALFDNYVESIQPVATGHERLMGTGKVQEALGALPKVQPYRAPYRAPLPVQRDTPATADPDKAQWEADWNDPAFAATRRFFNETSRPSGTPKERYNILCPLYKAHGVPRPLSYLKDDIDTSTTFFGSNTQAHKDMQAMLTKAETTIKALKDDKGNPKYAGSPFKQRPWALNVRTTSEGGWSNHATGKAIDLDPDTNPHLINRSHRAIINELTGFDIEKENPAEGLHLGVFSPDTYDAVKMTSELFQANYNEAGMNKRLDDMNDEKAQLTTQRDELTKQREELDKSKKQVVADRDAVLKNKASTADQRKEARERARTARADIDKRLTELKAQIKEKDAEIKHLQDRIKVLEAELKKFKREQKTFDAAVASAITAQAEVAASTEEVGKLSAEKEAASDQVEQAKTDKKDKKELAKLRKDLASKTAALSKATSTLKKNERALKKKIDTRDSYTLRKYAREGFLNLPKDVVEAMQGAGFKWGGEWSTHKDLMHFDMP